MKEPQFSFDVFLSHNSKDKPRVRMLAERLRSSGLRVWFDEWIIQPGDDIYLTIERGLGVSRTLILCLSDNAIGSDWVGLERSTVLFRDPSNADRRFIPLLLADCELPDTLRRYKYIDFRVESDEAFHQLLAACRPEYVDVSTRAMRPYPNARDHVPTLNATLGPGPGIRYYFDRWFPRLHWALTRTGLLSKPPELAVINSYLRELRAQIQNEFNEKTYLPLAGKPLAPVSPITQAIDRDPFVSPIHQVILQILGQSYGGDSASAQIAATSRQSRVVRNILKHLDHAQAPLILLGEPGSGKTMTMQQSTLLLAERESHQVFPKIPIYVRLGEFYVTGKVDRHDVWHYVKRSVNSSISHYLDEFVREGRLVIFFDGMDEMSRERYGEHTEALSIFAASSASQSLFTCRITDFSPRFLHQRLVILPFDRSQVSEYLHKYIEQFPLLIDNRLWSLKQLTKQIIQGELPIEANNPFVLWLLCLYLQDKQVWPKSRVEMLRYYNESNYQRKIEELPDDEPHFPKPEETFSAWARFAYLTTERNRGPAMPVHLLAADQDGARVEEMIRVGKRCGVLAESREQFGEHFRAAVSLLADHGNPITQVKMMRACQNIPQMDFIESLRKPLNSPINWVRNQALLLIASSQASMKAVGSDLATEIAYDLANGLFLNRLPAYWKAACTSRNLSHWWSLLAGACSYLANIILLLAMAATLYFGIWSLNSVYYKDINNIDSNTANIINRLTSQISPAKWAYYDKDEWKYNLDKAFQIQVDSSQPVNLISIDFRSTSVLSSPICMIATSIIVLLFIILASILRPSWIGIAALESAVWSAILTPMFFSLWSGSWIPLLIIICLGCFIYGTTGLIGSLIQFSTLGIYWVVTVQVRKYHYNLMTFLAIPWQNCYKDCLDFAVINALILGFFSVILIIYMPLCIILLAALVSGLQLISDVSHLPFHPLINVSIVSIFLFEIYEIVCSYQGKDNVIRKIIYKMVYLSLPRLNKIDAFIIKWLTILSIIIIPIGFIIYYFNLGYYFNLIILRILVVATFLIVVWLFRTSWLRVLRSIFVSWGTTAIDFVDDKDWSNQIAAADAETQRYMLRNIDQQKLSLNATDYLDYLKSIQPSIKEEPALSTYWELRYRLEEALRQERQG